MYNFEYCLIVRFFKVSKGVKDYAYRWNGTSKREKAF